MAIKNYDLVVIGAGPAGVSGAVTAAVFGRRVALIERDPIIGGAGINTGTIPSKTLRETALTLSGYRSRDLHGVDLSLRREATIADLMHHERQVTERARSLQLHRLRHFDVDIFYGAAEFADPNVVRIALRSGNEMFVRGDCILIASGSSPARPAVFPFEDDRIHDSNEILDLENLPKALAVIGAGVIGAEYACTFSALGSKVRLIDGRDELLPFLDRDISDALAFAMERSGIEFIWNEKVERCDTTSDDVILTLTSGRTIHADGVLVAAGRQSNVDSLNLAAAGITPGKRGIIPVDGQYRTEVSHIFAAGDVIGFPALASASLEQARVAMCHAFGLEFKVAIPHLLPSGIYTIPEVSMVGETEESLREIGVDYIVGKATYLDNPRGQIIGDETGMLKLLFRADDMTLLGVHVIGEQATELVHIGLVAMLSGAGSDLFNAACFNYPTLGDLYKYATYDAMMRRARRNDSGE